MVAFSFGLLHGFGFAGALAQVGLPQKAIPLALLTFNVGVELGQLLFVVFALGTTRSVGSRACREATVDVICNALRDRWHRDVLGMRTRRCVLIKIANTHVSHPEFLGE